MTECYVLFFIPSGCCLEDIHSHQVGWDTIGTPGDTDVYHNEWQFSGGKGMDFKNQLFNCRSADRLLISPVK